MPWCHECGENQEWALVASSVSKWDDPERHSSNFPKIPPSRGPQRAIDAGVWNEYSKEDYAIDNINVKENAEDDKRDDEVCNGGADVHQDSPHARGRAVWSMIRRLGEEVK